MSRSANRCRPLDVSIPNQRDDGLTVAVLCGGLSAERDISLSSGAAVAAALESRVRRVTRIDADPATIRAMDWSGVDVAFNALHGQFGEDGQLQRTLNAEKVPYTGSGAEASRLAFSKSATKQQLIASGIQTPDFKLIHHADHTTRLLSLADEIGYPLVVKPDQQGSSLGVTIVQCPSEFIPAVVKCFALNQFGVIEQYIAGEEWTVPVFDEDILPPIRVGAVGGFYDFDAKYRDDQTSYSVFPVECPDLPRGMTELVRRTCATIETKGIARVDLRVDASGRAWVLEVNTSPGMTDHSLVPKSAEFIGLSLGDLCEEACHRAMADHRQRLDKAA